MNILCSRLISFIVLPVLGVSTAARADVYGSFQVWTGVFQDAGHSLVETNSFHSVFFYTYGPDFPSSIRMTLPGVGEVDAQEATTAYWRYVDTSRSFAQLPLAYPSGVTSFAVTGGALDGLRDSYEIPASLFTPFTPARLSSTTRAVLESGFDWSTGADLVITIDPPTDFQVVRSVLLTLSDASGYGYVEFAFDPGAGSLVVPNAILTGWSGVSLEIASRRTAAGAWTSANPDSGYADLSYNAYVNSGPFGLVPAPGAVGLLVVVAVPMARRRR